MKKFGLVLALIFSQMMLSQNLEEYRALLKTGEHSERSASLLIKKSSSAYKSTNEPIYAGFLAVGQFFMAKHTLNPLKKISYFSEGKKTLETAVDADPKNLEIRLIRLITQENVPKMLGYNDHISEDRKFLTQEYKNSPDKELKGYIKDYLKL